MFWVTVSIVVAVALVAWYLFRPHRMGGGNSRRARAARQDRLKKRLVRTPEDMAEMGDVRGLTLKLPHRGRACRRALENAEKTFVTHEAPPLPLAGCDVGKCRCSYYAIPGRRSGKDRRAGHDRRESIRFDSDKPDRRSGKDRRRTGHDPWKGRA